jgi:hypothetical protein
MFETTLLEEYMHAHSAMEMSASSLLRITEMGFENAFLSFHDVLEYSNLLRAAASNNGFDLQQ